VKKILACAFVVATRIVDANLFARACKLFVARRRLPTIDIAKSPYFIAIFACSAQHGRSGAIHSSRTATLRGALHHADTRFVKSKAVFFIAL
jgi:hypothetical protein